MEAKLASTTSVVRNIIVFYYERNVLPRKYFFKFNLHVYKQISAAQSARSVKYADYISAGGLSPRLKRVS